MQKDRLENTKTVVHAFPLMCEGFTLTRKLTRGSLYWYGFRKRNYKVEWVYIGTDLNLAEKKITEWKKRKEARAVCIWASQCAKFRFCAHGVPHCVDKFCNQGSFCYDYEVKENIQIKDFAPKLVACSLVN